MPTVTVRDADGALRTITTNDDPATGAKQDALQTAVGAAGDAAWSGSGSGGLIGILKAIWNVLAGKGLADSGVTTVTGTLSSGTLTTQVLRPAAGRPAYVELKNAGSGPVTVVYECADGSYAPNAVATDGGTPIIMDKVAYAGSAVRLTIETTIPNQGVKLLPGTLTGTVEFALRQ